MKLEDECKLLEKKTISEVRYNKYNKYSEIILNFTDGSRATFYAYNGEDVGVEFERENCHE